LDQANKTVDKHSKIYQLAYQAILKLNAPMEVLEKFRPLDRKDLQVNTDVTEENRVGQRSDVLAWFWREGSESSDKKDEWMQEGE
jgi:hypothetical protein